MKTLFIAFIALLYLPAFAQNTTEEEYNYMIKGYKVQTESGLNMKASYYFDDTKEYTDENGNYSFTYKFLKRKKDKTLAGVLIIATSKITGNYYLGLPIGGNVLEESGISSFYDSSFMDNFFSSVKNDIGTGAMGDAFNLSLYKLFARTAH